MSTVRTLIGGAGFGAALVFMLDPITGRRRRALMRDKVVYGLRKTRDAAGATSRDLVHRASGFAAEARSLVSAEPADDTVLIERVRAKLGRVCSHPGAIDVSASDGTVILSGPILAHEVSDVLWAIWRVRGVENVDNQLEVHEEAGDIPALQGGAARPGDRFELMQVSWSPTARLLVGGAGGVMLTYGMSKRGPLGLALGAAGLGMLARAATNLEMKRLAGVGGGRRAVDIQKGLRIEAPVDEVFSFWENFENFPRFMTHVLEIRPTRLEGQTHWTVEGPGGIPIEFNAVVTELIPNEVLAWRTVEGSPVAHAGFVRFETTVDGATRLTIRMSYNPPGGALAHGVAALFGADAKHLMDDDLVRLKTLLETGRPPRDAAKPFSEPSRSTI